jgi:hypothetical protein
LPRRFDAAGITALVEGAWLAVQDLHGVRIFSDLVPAAYVDSDADAAALLELEQIASRHPDYAFLGHIGAALHVLGPTRLTRRRCPGDEPAPVRRPRTPGQART